MSDDHFAADSKEFDPNVRVHVLKNALPYDSETYSFNDSFVPASELTPNSVHTTLELLGLLERDPKIEIDARVIAVNAKREATMKRFPNREKFLESFRACDTRLKKLEEADDFFGSDFGIGQIVDGHDFVPLLGGPFYKQLYQYDYLRMHNACFFAWHHDPVAKATVEMIVDFVLGRGFKVVATDANDGIAKQNQIQWDSFAKANNLRVLARQYLTELIVYGESMVWKLPNNQSKIVYQLGPGQKTPVGIIPRIRLIDPSCIWEIVTYPEDITRVLFYQWLAPTQYQTYTSPNDPATIGASQVPSTKFIFTQIPAEQIHHCKINAASNEKRGRSDLFASLGYLKRLRDCVNYAIISDQKRAAWSIDTEIQGNQADIDGYRNAMLQLGTIPSAGSEFIHTAAVKRQYLSNPGAASQMTNSFEWCLSMAAIGNRIPVSYYGTHLSGGQTKASALVSTEPVAKMFESRQIEVEYFLRDLYSWVTGSDSCEITFPEIIAQDSAVKIRNIVVADANKYMSKARCATMAAKELNVTDFDYTTEEQEIKKEMSAGLDQNPLTTPGSFTPGNPEVAGQTSTPTVLPGAASVGGGGAIAPKNKSAVTGQDRAAARANG